MTRRKGKGLGCCVAIFIVLLILTLAMMGENRGDPSTGWNSTIVSDLRSMKFGIMFFFEDSADEIIHWTALPGGVSSVDAPGRYLSAYMDHPERYAKPGHPYRLEITSDDHGVLWRAGCVIPVHLRFETTAYISTVKEKLMRRARLTGLYDETGKLYSGGDVVYMAASFDLGARGGP